MKKKKTGEIMEKQKELEKIEVTMTNNPNWKKIKQIADTSIHEKLFDGEVADEETRAYMLKFLLGEKMIGFGTRRAVFEKNGYAVKIPIEVCGQGENEQEQELWNTIRRKYKKHFVPCIGGNKYYSVYELAQNVNKKEIERKENEILSWMGELEKEGFTFTDGESNRSSQWGKINEQFVLIDYGGVCLKNERKQNKKSRSY